MNLPDTNELLTIVETIGHAHEPAALDAALVYLVHRGWDDRQLRHAVLELSGILAIAAHQMEERLGRSDLLREWMLANDIEEVLREVVADDDPQ